MILPKFYSEQDKVRRLDGVLCKHDGIVKSIVSTSSELSTDEIKLIVYGEVGGFVTVKSAELVDYTKTDLEFDLPSGYFIDRVTKRIFFSSRKPTRTTYLGWQRHNTYFYELGNKIGVPSSRVFGSESHRRLLEGKTEKINNVTPVLDGINRGDFSSKIINHDCVVRSVDNVIVFVDFDNFTVAASSNRGKSFDFANKKYSRIFGDELEAYGFKLN